MSNNVLLTLRDILAEETDANHPIQKAELMKKCRLHGVEINARTLTRHLDTLREHYPSKVHCAEHLYVRDGVESSRKTNWYWESDEFIEGEVRLLEDIVSQLPLIAPRDRRDLLSRLGSVLNNYGSEVPEDIATFRKAQNRQFLYNVEAISAAIAERHVIEYELGHYDENGNLGSYGKEAKRKRICPYFFCSANNNYYLLGKYENTGKLYPLCVGMMFNVIEATDENGNRESFSWEPPRDFNLTRYVQQHVHMQNDEPCRARIRLHTKDDDQQSMMLHQIFRQFGTDAKVPSGQLPNAPMEVSIFSSERGLKFWALQFADLVEVVEPESLREAVKESARKILNKEKHDVVIFEDIPIYQYIDGLFAAGKSKREAVNELGKKDLTSLPASEPTICEGIYPHIKRWLEHEIKGRPDPDQFLKNTFVVEALGWDGLGYRYRTWNEVDDDDSAALHSVDCMYSVNTMFETFVNHYLRKYSGRGWKNRLYEAMERPDFSESIQDILDIQGFLNRLDRYIAAYHTLGNYLPCPDGWVQAEKNNMASDRQEIFLKIIPEKISSDVKHAEWWEYRETWYKENEKRLFMADFLEEYRAEKNLLCNEGIDGYFRGDIDSLEPVNNYLEKVTELIQSRSKVIAEHLVVSYLNIRETSDKRKLH